ncbi:SOUL heme-binding protein [Trema orientale]|uniref:SOUL heme-binding protein n=1 Tax=Trema orientale TaxID=63057 RepID=A0A2P5EC06_TREOI|nr:SOUL heme-binding protein [Trema orientale]
MLAQGMILFTIPTISPSLKLLKRHMSISMADNRATQSVPPRRTRTRPMSAAEARISLVFALALQTSSTSQRLLADLATETTKYVFPKRFETRTLEEALMSVPDLETVNFRVLSRTDQYEIREVEPYFIAETTMPGKTGFDFNGASQSFNVLAEYLFGKNTRKEQMEMTTPVITRKAQSNGEKMEMTTPVITKRVEDQDKWQMSFVLPSKYGTDLPLPNNPSVKIKEVPRKIVAVVAFSGFVTDEEVKQREFKLREALKNDRRFQVKQGASVEVAQYNPPFTLPFQRRNEIALEVEKREE